MAESKKRFIDSNSLKELREKFIRGEIHFDYESDMVDGGATAYS